MQVITIIGYLAKNPEIRCEGTPWEFCTFPVAVNSQKRSAKDNTLIHKVTYYQIRVMGEKGRNCHTYLTKGRKVCVIGTLEVSLAQDKEENQVFSQSGKPIVNLDISASHVEFLSGPTSQEEKENALDENADSQNKPSDRPDPLANIPSDLPF